jgi:hypothetical protein
MAGKYQMFGLVRDGATGKPKVDNVADLHPIHLGQMSKDERNEFGVWDGDWARDAQGIKRVEKQPNGDWKAIDPLVAVNEIFDLSDNPNETKIMVVTPRRDIGIDGLIPAAHVTPA